VLPLIRALESFADHFVSNRYAKGYVSKALVRMTQSLKG
jgi:hypothetical protein